MKLGIMGGTESRRLTGVGQRWRPAVDSPETPYGTASAIPDIGSTASGEVVLLPRHGKPARVAPHLINYRANMWLMRELGVDAVVATYAVGGIASELRDADLLVPHQIIDYTWGRDSTPMSSPARFATSISLGRSMRMSAAA